MTRHTLQREERVTVQGHVRKDKMSHKGGCHLGSYPPTGAGGGGRGGLPLSNGLALEWSAI